MKGEEARTIAGIVLKASELVLLCHVDPDGDAIGSLLGLGLALKAAGRRVSMVSPDGIPPSYAFLPGVDEVERTIGELGDATVVIVLDCGDLDRVGALREKVAGHPLILNIDHHPTNGGFGRYNLVDPQAAATAELVLLLLDYLELPLSLPVAICLYTGLHTDTGGFRYENTSPQVHRAAERLLKVGVKPWEIADFVYDTKPLAQVLLIKEALSRLKLGCAGRLAWISLPRSVLRDCGTDDTSGLINYPRMIAGVEVALLFKETEEGTVRVGLRSRHVDVSRLALRFGGGGHARAAGCTLAGPLEKAEEIMIKAAEQVLEEELAGE
ncbi:MAG: bifunctional oligoribonuclease and phosphatase NrnA [Bacillota bacterium]|nr:bifunctional oligoribonuclease and phosphatase NrnA [Bacillota bacterium]MDK2881689.1 bifunctional oligoribonuclease and phosphatase NrnA [Bacillota bacterium]MDK2959860.1 bifunctional oligoribonuclease and phosphatase NrnA [Bacillota bacterium]